VESSEKLQTNIYKITKYIIKAIKDMRLYYRYIHSKHSKSRYLEVYTGIRMYKIRISDHPLHLRWRYDYDVYTKYPRKDANNYEEFIRLFRKRVKADGGFRSI
jgi:hypothetical protein